ncbi:hypothetical protein GCM10022222_76550 [Amycolatopsis ultiminotia]|uniref:Uncharacterized protein n=1 Tax=Amycolatopsis ultiminotia TaxID=543629 RepID=A0ABP6YEQ8_9PSEU
MWDTGPGYGSGGLVRGSIAGVMWLANLAVERVWFVNLAVGWGVVRGVVVAVDAGPGGWWCRSGRGAGWVVPGSVLAAGGGWDGEHPVVGSGVGFLYAKRARARSMGPGV